MVRHVCGISGGKDSSALAVYMRDKVPEMEYFFCDTGAELPETYTYLKKLETVLGKSIARLNSSRGFNHYSYILNYIIKHFTSKDGNSCITKVMLFTISGPEGLRSLDLTLRKRSHYPCYATSPKFRMFSP